MRTSYSPQSELRLSLEDYLRLSASEPIVSAIVARVLPRGFGAYGPTVVHSFLLFIIGGPLSVPGIQKRIRSLPDLTGRLTVRADGGHAPPLS